MPEYDKQLPLGIKFSNTEVLKGEWEKVYRKFSLQRAERLCNAFKDSSVTLLIIDDEKQTVILKNTRIDMFNDEFTTLKKDPAVIPTRAILGVEF
jgi:hypothetical protein